MVSIPTPSDDLVIGMIIGLLFGLPAPYWYMQERIRGAIRYYVDKKFPYKPPPGMTKEEALVEATDSNEPSEKEIDEKIETEEENNNVTQ